METQINEIEQNTVGTIRVQYYRPKFVHRVLANLVDFIIFGLVFFGIFAFVRYEFTKGPTLSSTIKQLDALKVESGMYVERDGSLVDIVSYLDKSTVLTNGGKAKAEENAIDSFFTFIAQYRTETEYEYIENGYQTNQLAATSSGYHLFIYDEEIDEVLSMLDLNDPSHPQYEKYEFEYIEEKEYFDIHKHVFVGFYAFQIDNSFQGLFATTQVVYDLTKTINNYLLWVELPISLVSSVILVYFVPTLFFRKTRYTLGKALYRIGTVDSRYLAVGFGRNLAKWSLFLLEMILGIVSIGVIFICSFTLMAFSKHKQGFPDYMLGLQEIDCSKNKIYKSYIEIEIDKAETNKKPNDFKLIDNP